MLTQLADAARAFRKDQWSARLEPINAGAEGQLRRAQRLIQIRQIERELNCGAHE
jgi:hypothetical protein